MLRIIGLLIWILGLHAYFVLFVAFAAARKNQLIRISTAISGLATMWVFCTVAMKLGVSPCANFWFRISIVSLAMIPCAIYLVIRLMDGEKLITPFSVSMMILSVTMALLSLTDLYYGYEIIKFDGSHIGTMVIDDIYEVSLYPRLGSLFIVFGESLIIFLSIRILWQMENLKFRKLLIASSLVYWFSGILSFTVPSAFPFELIGGLGSIIVLMAVFKERKALNMNLFIKPQLFSLFSGIFMLLYCILLYCRNWGSLDHYKHAVIFTMACSAITVVVMTILYEYFYSRFFTDRGNYLMRCNSEYNRAILEMLGDVDAITDSFLKTINTVYGNGEIVLYVYDEKLQSYALKSTDCFDTPYFEVGGDFTRIVAGKSRTFNASLVIDAIDHNSLLYQEIWNGSLRWITPLKVKDALIGFYFVGGFKMKWIDTMEKEAIAALCKTTALALQETYMMHKAEKDSKLDPNSGLSTRHVMTDVLQKALDEKREFSVFLFSIDDMSFFNSVYGQKEGDALIRSFSSTLRTVFDENAALGRLSGKSFAAMIECSSEEAIRYDATLRCSFALSNQDNIRRSVTFSTGLLHVSGDEGYTPNDVIDHIDVAMHYAKKNGKNHLQEWKKEIVDKLEFGDAEFRVKTIEAISKALDLKDHFTYGHSINVASYARAIAEAAGLDRFECETIFQAGLVHDIGKISIPDSILMNPGKLTDEEYGIIKTHVDRSEEVVKTLPLGFRMLPIALSHHERWDGRGYPNGLSGLDIPIGGRCLSIADTFDAMTSRRVYRKALSVDAALEEIERCSGTQFDPDLGPLFVKLVREGKITPHPYY